jgi:hypothetical protein
MRARGCSSPKPKIVGNKGTHCDRIYCPLNLCLPCRRSLEAYLSLSFQKIIRWSPTGAHLPLLYHHIACIKISKSILQHHIMVIPQSLIGNELMRSRAHGSCRCMAVRHVNQQMPRAAAGRVCLRLIAGPRAANESHRPKGPDLCMCMCAYVCM